MKNNPAPAHGPRPAATADARASLDIRLDGWPGTTAVAFICGAAVLAFRLYLKCRFHV